MRRVSWRRGSGRRRFNAILARLEAAGTLVFYEWVGSAAETQWSAASHAERDARTP